jgi:hypothetical protein
MTSIDAGAESRGWPAGLPVDRPGHCFEVELSCDDTFIEDTGEHFCVGISGEHQQRLRHGRHGEAIDVGNCDPVELVGLEYPGYRRSRVGGSRDQDRRIPARHVRHPEEPIGCPMGQHRAISAQECSPQPLCPGSRRRGQGTHRIIESKKRTGANTAVDRGTGKAGFVCLGETERAMLLGGVSEKSCAIHHIIEYALRDAPNQPPSSRPLVSAAQRRGQRHTMHPRRGHCPPLPSPLHNVAASVTACSPDEQTAHPSRLRCTTSRPASQHAAQTRTRPTPPVSAAPGRGQRHTMHPRRRHVAPLPSPLHDVAASVTPCSPDEASAPGVTACSPDEDTAPPSRLRCTTSRPASHHAAQTRGTSVDRGPTWDACPPGLPRLTSRSSSGVGLGGFLRDREYPE